ncbi:SCO family protein [Methylobacterium dankookense]|uniref:SCO family protein n=1 Tax=Methylobacterium dankookense TaxID=560405 RepID=UPI001EDE7FCA|nr:SCO family protein [Methylobacterium dankookense]
MLAAPARTEEAPRRSAAELMDVLMWNREPVGGPFALVDHAGRPRTEADFRGKLLIVYFGFTACPDICPTDLMEIARALTLLGAEAERVQAVFVTLDPDHDTPAHLAAYLQSFHPALIGLTGSPDAIRRMADAYKVYFAKAEGADGNGTIEHSAFVYLMDRSGAYLGFFPPGTSAERMLTIIRPQMAAERSGTR